MPSNRLLRTSAIVVGLVLFASACGGGSSGLSSVGTSTPAPAEDTAGATESTEAGSDLAADEPSEENQLPQVPVIDIATGEEVVLSTFAPAATPIVLWFWAPH
ncbi:MAG: hypothetical protein ACR2PK_15825 [Acidimicrobiales bacterium]